MRVHTIAPSRALVTLSTLLAALVLLLASAVQAGDAPISLDVYTVAPGDTLWVIADDVTPAGRDVRETVSIIQQVNRLEGSLIRPGQVLQVPAGP